MKLADSSAPGRRGCDGGTACRLAVYGFFALVTAYIGGRYALVILRGGNYWTTGDWLIHYGEGFVRRGLTGTLTLALSDLTGIAPVPVAGAMQIAVLVAMVAALLYAFSSVPWTTPVLMLMFSPALILMPFYFTKLAGQKETLGVLALALMAGAGWKPRMVLFWAGAALAGLAGFAHEINAFLVPPALVFPLLYARGGQLGRGAALAGAALIALPGALALGLSVLMPQAGVAEGLCADLALRFDPWRFCGPEGPIHWLEQPTGYGMAFTWQENVATGVWPWFILGFALSVAPFFLMRATGDPQGRRTLALRAAAVLGVLTVAPLFVVATDWGRWISMYVFAAAMIAVVLLRMGLVTGRRLRGEAVLVFLYAFGWSMTDYGAPLSPGLIGKALNAAHRVVPGLAPPLQTGGTGAGTGAGGVTGGATNGATGGATGATTGD